jgi:S-adenosylmethionine:tRNA ribosyltransferase-isomerase
VVAADGGLRHTARALLAEQLAPGDLLVANDAATLPASLAGVHVPTGAVVEVRLAGRPSLAPGEARDFTAVVFGAGDFRTPTEDRPPPPPLRLGDRLRLGPLATTILATLGHPRLVRLRFAGSADAIWAGIASHGKAIQYAHLARPLALPEVWTRIAALPAAFEPPSAGFALDWAMLSALAARRIGFATLTHAAGISSTGDPALDARLPFDEPYRLPATTVRAIEETRARGGRVVAVGTTVTRALEHAVRRPGGLRPGPGLATQRLGAGTPLEVVDALLTGVHQPGDSHYELLRAFAGDAVLARMSAALEQHGYRSHEFGDSVLLRRQAARRASEPGIDDPDSGRFEVAHVAGDDRHPVDERRGGDQRVPKRPRIWNVQRRAALPNGRVHGQDAAGEGRQDMIVQPGSQYLPLGSIPPLDEEDAELQLVNGDRGQEEAGERHLGRPRRDLWVRLPSLRLPQLGDDIRIEQEHHLRSGGRARSRSGGTSSSTSSTPGGNPTRSMTLPDSPASR